MKKILIFIYVAISLLFASCAKPDYPTLDDSCSLDGLKCLVYYDSSNSALYESVDLLSGTYYPEKGLIGYTFKQGEKINSETLTRCRIEAIIPSTARLELLDASGKSLGMGFSGFYDLGAATMWFKVVAANGDEKVFQLTTTLKP